MNQKSEDRILRLAKIWAVDQDLLRELTKQIAKVKKSIAEIEQEDLPQLMKECNYKNVTFDDGSTVEIVDDINAGINKADDDGEAAYQWLIDQGFGGLIKTKVLLEFGKGGFSEANQAAEAIKKLDYNPLVERGVHASTFKAFAKEQRAQARDLPKELFKICPFSKAKINLKTQPKKEAKNG